MTGAQRVLSLKTMAAALTLPSLREVKMILSSTLLRIGKGLVPLVTVWTKSPTQATTDPTKLDPSTKMHHFGMPALCDKKSMQEPMWTRMSVHGCKARTTSSWQLPKLRQHAGLYGCHQDNTVSHQTKRQKCEKNKDESATLSACGWYGPLNTSPTRICLENRL